MGLKFLVAPTSFQLSCTVGNEAGLENLTNISRQAIFDSISSASSFNLDFDFYSATTINYCYLGNIANAVRRAGIDGNGDSITLTFYADDNSSFTTPESDTVTIQLSDLVGFDAKDWYQELNFTTSYRYYRCKIETTMSDSIRLYLSNLWFGEAYDLGKCPNLPIQVNYKPMPIYYDKEFIFNYSNLNDDDRLSIYENLDKNKLTIPVVLLDEDNDLLTGDTLAYCNIVDAEYSTKVDGIYDIRLTFKTNY